MNNNTRTVSSGFDQSDWRNLLYTELGRTGGDPSILFEILEGIIEQRAWEDLLDKEGKPVGSLRRLIEEPLPVGCGKSTDKVLRLLQIEHRYEHNSQWKERMAKLRKAVELELEKELPPVKKHGTNRHTTDNSRVDMSTLENDDPKGGNSRSYTIRKVKAVDPELAQRVLNKELSANEAAVMAGIRPPKVTIRLDDMTSIANTLRKKLSREQISELIDILNEVVT